MNCPAGKKAMADFGRASRDLDPVLVGGVGRYLLVGEAIVCQHD